MSTPTLPLFYGKPINTPSGHKWAGPAMPPADRVPSVWSDACRYCKRYRRSCGRHES